MLAIKAGVLIRRLKQSLNFVRLIMTMARGGGLIPDLGWR